MKRLMQERGVAAALFSLPALLVFCGFVIYPMLQAVWFSFFNWNGFGEPTQFVEAQNYVEAIQTPAFRRALFDVLVLIAAALVIQVPLGLGCALLVGSEFRGAVTYRLILFLPYVLAQTATGLVFTFLYDGRYGLAAAIARWLDTEPVYALADPSLALPAVVVVMVWKYFGFSMMLFVAGLQSLDRSQIEAAQIDGATRAQILRYITLPHLRPVAVLVAFFAVLTALQVFDLIMALTLGGPNDTTQTLVTYLYSHGLARLRIGYGNAVGVILFALCLLATLLFKTRKEPSRG
jgi:raffinose/stachyose/melibiose transport system permease protein